MPRLWSLLQKRKSARDVIALLAPIAIALAGGIWAVVTYAWPAHDAAPTAICAEQGIAIGGNVAGSKIINKASGGAPTAAPCVNASSK